MSWPGELPDEIRSAVETVVACNVAAIERAVAEVRLEAPAYALTFLPDDAGEVLLGQVAYLGLDPDRERALREGTEWEAFRAVWNPHEWAIGPLMTTAHPPQELIAAGNAVMEYADRVGVVAEPIVFGQVARRLTEKPPVAPVTDDFVAFLFEEGFSEDLLAALETGATPEVLLSLREKRLLPERWEDLEGSPQW